MKRINPLLDIAFSYIYFIAFYLTTNFKTALLEAYTRLSKFGGGKILRDFLIYLSVSREFAIREGDRRPELHGLIIAMLDEECGVDKRQTVSTIENMLNFILRRLEYNAGLYVTIVELILVLTILSSIIPPIATLLGVNVVQIGYVIPIVALATVYVLELVGLKISSGTTFSIYAKLTLALSYTTFALLLLMSPLDLASSLALGYVMAGIVSLCTLPEYIKHFRTVTSFPVRVRLSFNLLFRGRGAMYRFGYVDNMLDAICFELYNVVKVSGAEVLSVVFRLVDNLAGTLRNVRLMLTVLSLLAFAILLGLTLMFTFSIYQICTLADQAVVSIGQVKIMQALSLGVASFIVGKLFDNEFTGTYMLLPAGLVSLLLNILA